MPASKKKLILFTVVPKDQVKRCKENNIYALEPEGYYIGLRQSMQGAVDRAIRGGEYITKGSHMMLRFEFSTLGVGYFTTQFDDASYHFTPVLYKKCGRWSDYDRGVWHFSQDLPLSLKDDEGNDLVTSRFCQMK